MYQLIESINLSANYANFCPVVRVISGQRLNYFSTHSFSAYF
jgi:hypothetical protein